MMELERPKLKALKFEERRHRFTINGSWVPSVSKLTRQYMPEFDADFFSKKVAAKRGITQEEVLAEWEEKKKASVALGEEVHTAIELYLLPETPELALLMEQHMSTMSAAAHERFLTWMTKVAHRFDAPILLNGVPAVEIPIYHRFLRYAGIADLIASTSGGIWVFDWKSNGEYNVESEYGKKCKPPFDDLDACEHTEYSIQGSLLRMALESHDIPTGGSATAWLGPEGMLKVKAGMDLRERLTEALKERRGA